jgi:hypothetical protein
LFDWTNGLSGYDCELHLGSIKFVCIT